MALVNELSVFSRAATFFLNSKFSASDFLRAFCD